MNAAHGADGAPVGVDAVGGACLLVKRGVFEQVGMLSLDYLMYGDDLDLCYRVTKAGYGVYYTRQAKVVHHGGKSTASWKQSLADVWIRDSIYKFIVKTRGKSYGVLHKATMASAAIVRIVLIGCEMLFARNTSRLEQLKLTLLKWVRIFQWAIGRKKWAKSAGRELGFAPNEW
jgi:GT2 family glycosyltransferase